MYYQKYKRKETIKNIAYMSNWTIKQMVGILETKYNNQNVAIENK